MENWFDKLSKDVAKAVSRREALAVIGRTFLGVTLASLGSINRADGASGVGDNCSSYCKQQCTSSDPQTGRVVLDFACLRQCIPVCKNGCGICQDCDLSTKTCGTCSEACTSGNLLRLATADTDFLKLTRYLSNQGYKSDPTPRSLILRQNGEYLRSVVGISYAHPSLLNQSTLLSYGIEATGETKTYVTVFQDDGSSAYALVVGPDGQVIRVDGSGSSGNSMISLTSASGTANSTDIVTPNAVQGSCNATNCELICGFPSAVYCTLLTAAICGFTGPGVVLCGLALGLECYAVTALACIAGCERLYACSKCQDCLNGQCVAKQCGTCQECNPSTGACQDCDFCCNGSCQSTPCNPQKIYCFCNDTCYDDEDTCFSECHESLACFTGICGPAQPGQCGTTI